MPLTRSPGQNTIWDFCSTRERLSGHTTTLQQIGRIYTLFGHETFLATRFKYFEKYIHITPLCFETYLVQLRNPLQLLHFRDIIRFSVDLGPLYTELHKIRKCAFFQNNSQLRTISYILV